jgi:hypothetical protein
VPEPEHTRFSPIHSDRRTRGFNQQWRGQMRELRDLRQRHRRGAPSEFEKIEPLRRVHGGLRSSMVGPPFPAVRAADASCLSVDERLPGRRQHCGDQLADMHVVPVDIFKVAAICAGAGRGSRTSLNAKPSNRLCRKRHDPGHGAFHPISDVITGGRGPEIFDGPKPRLVLFVAERPILSPDQFKLAKPPMARIVPTPWAATGDSPDKHAARGAMVISGTRQRGSDLAQCLRAFGRRLARQPSKSAERAEEQSR